MCMARTPLLAAVIDEVDQALAALQTARRFLREMEREAPSPPRADARAQPQGPLEPTPSLRFSGITVPEAAEILGMSEDHVRRLLRAGQLLGAPYSGRIGWRLDAAYVHGVAEQLRAAREGRQRARRKPAPRRKPQT
jgi:excisionase family DNA binding protein